MMMMIIIIIIIIIIKLWVRLIPYQIGGSPSALFLYVRQLSNTC